MLIIAVNDDDLGIDYDQALLRITVPTAPYHTMTHHFAQLQVINYIIHYLYLHVNYELNCQANTLQVHYQGGIETSDYSL